MSRFNIEHFKNVSNAFNFYFEKNIAPKSFIVLKMPSVSANKRGINDIGFTAEDGITIQATLSSNPYDDTALWQEIRPFDEINKTATYLKIINNSDNSKRVNIRAILN